MTPKHIRAGRAWLGWSQADLSERTKISVTSIGNIEAGRTKEMRRHIFERIQAAFTEAGVVFECNGLREAEQHG